MAAYTFPTKMTTVVSDDLSNQDDDINTFLLIYYSLAYF